MARHGRERAPQRRDGVVGVARLLAAPRDLEVDRRRALEAVGADPVRVGVDARQQLERLLVARPQAHDLGEPLRRRVELLELLAQHAPEAEQEVGAALGVGRTLELELVEPHDAAVVAERAVDLARRLDRLDVLGRELARPLRVADDALELAEVVDEELAHLRLQLGDAGRVARARDGGGLHLEHRHVVGHAALLAIDVLEARRRADVARVAVDGVREVGLGAHGVAQLVEPQLGREVEELARLRPVVDGLGARLVERHELVVRLRLAVRLAQRHERLGVGGVALEGGFVLANRGHGGDLFPCRSGRSRTPELPMLPRALAVGARDQMA